jgi:hypothetical protein
MRSGLPGCVLLLAKLSACASYTPQQMGAMSDYQLCRLDTVYRASLSQESAGRLRAELERRREDCTKHQSAIRAQLDYELDEAMYGGQSP